MANMSYCRFQNTAQDIKDCIDAINEEDLKEMSNREEQAFIDFVLHCKEVAESFEDMDEDEIREFINNKNK